MAEKNPDIQAAVDRRAKLRVIADEQLLAGCGSKPFWIVSDGWGIEVDGVRYTPSILYTFLTPTPEPTDEENDG